jgi:hypothetical protein
LVREPVARSPSSFSSRSIALDDLRDPAADEGQFRLRHRQRYDVRISHLRTRPSAWPLSLWDNPRRRRRRVISTFIYYSFQNLNTGEWQGLLRFDPAKASYSYVREGAWIAGSPERLEMFVFPGADAPELVERALAEKLADRYGVELVP